VDQAIDRAFQQRPDLMELAEIRSANGRIKEARAAYCGRIELNSP
jgi:outer membrane protein TolC